ncbi:hybrid sensor histidine kinase/response regulator transcription factor [Bizionia myxarmorum]|uniref:histidine kinase n=1 Tax=Bizionia myxarmorum TaxID=291186 RepID=A0A5D0R4V2_9FLAO|nr:two-component regulator propeller domain-containing protein [Bizionia myxarmorum]TYB76453.1 response regulator [Bizionia myxarmorum]
MRNLTLLFIWFVPCFVFSQSNKQIAFRELTVEDGLSQNSVVSIAQDSIGYLWFATQDGLNKYDGKKFKSYNIQFEDVTRTTYSKLGKIYSDKLGGIWIVSNSGILEKYQQELDQFKPVLNTNQVSTLIQDGAKNFYIGTYDNGLIKINHKTKDTLQFLKPADAKRTIYDFLETPNKAILAATNNGLIKITNDRYQFIKIVDDTNFSSLASSNQETIYAGSFGRGLFLKKDEEELFKSFSGFDQDILPNNLNIQDLLVDKNDRLWIATYGQGVYLVDFKYETVKHFLANKNNPFALHYNDVLCLFQDFTGTIWLGTDGAGLSYFDEYLTKFNVLTNNQMPKDIHVDVIRAISVKNNDIWGGTSGKGLTKINVKNEDFETLTSENSNLLTNRVMSLFHYKDELWIGHQNQGLQKRTAAGQFINFQETSAFTIWNISEASNNKLWLCTRNHGLILFDIEKGIQQHYSIENSNLTSDNIRVIKKQNDHTFWIGTEDEGIFKLDIEQNAIEEILQLHYPVKSLFLDKNMLWIGTNGDGLISYNTLTNKRNIYTTAEGIPNNVIYGILPDENGSLWISSNKGISRFYSKNDSLSIENYTNYDGLQASEFNTGAYFKDDNNTLYFGGLEGLNWFNPNQLYANPTKPKTIISGLEVFNTERSLQPNQELKHSENTVTFTFSALHFSQPERNQYKYRLINNDRDWISSGHNNKAHYTNLPPNSYQFQVISSNYDGVWNLEPATHSFTILQPWYATNIARLVYFILGLIFLFILYKYLKWRWHVKNQLRLEHLETERLKKLDELKTKLYTNISHEFRTPLTLISGPIETQLSKKNLSKQDKKELGLVKQNANRLLKLVNQMLELSMLDSGQTKLKVSKGNLSILLKQLVFAFQYKATKKDIRIESRIEKLQDVWFDSDIIEKVVSNIFSNAVKYAPKESVIQFEASQQEYNLVISITNKIEQGSLTDLGKLFQRFYQNNEFSEGVGVGLALVRELVALAKGTIVANNMADNYIQFTVSLPLTEDAFTLDEIDTPVYIEPIITEKNTYLEIINDDTPLLLVVEDEPDIREFIISIFFNHYNIIQAKNGKEGVEMALKELPDLIISDIMMPLLDGINLCDTLKTNELTSHIPIILLTAKVGNKNEIEGLKTGADAHVTKPFSSEKLKLRVEKLIENRQKLKKHFSKNFQLNPELAITSTETEFLKRLQVTLDEYITNPDFNSDALGKQMQISRTQLHRKLKAITGMTTSEFLRSQRLKLSLELLKKSDATMAEIAYQIGFNSPSYFNKCFKDVYGCTPNEYFLKN